MDRNGQRNGPKWSNWNKMEPSDILTGHPDVGGKGEIGKMAYFFKILMFYFLMIRTNM